MAVTDASADEITITQRLLVRASLRGSHQALAGGPADHEYSYARLAATVQAAAAGLAWRGLRPRDVVGVYVPDAVSYVLGAHSIRAAGGVPSPVSAGLSVSEIAGQLADCGARMLLTSPPLAAAALAAADRSWVRQVISFSEVAGATRFGALLSAGTLQPARCRAHDLALLPYARDSGNGLAPVPVTHRDLAVQLRRLDVEAGICEDDVVLAAPPAGDGRAYTALLDHALTSGATVIAIRAEDVSAAARSYRGTTAIMPRGAPVSACGQLRVFAVAS